MIVLDCCRNGLAITVGGRSVDGCFISRAADSSAIRPQFPNTIVIQSTTSGNVAWDGGPFMRIFCEEIAHGGEVSFVVKRTRKRVLEEAPDFSQLVEFNSFQLDDFFFSSHREQQVFPTPRSRTWLHQSSEPFFSRLENVDDVLAVSEQI